MDWQAQTDYWLSRLRQEAYPFDPAREGARRAVVATAAALRAPQRQYQHQLESAVARVEGFAPPLLAG